MWRCETGHAHRSGPVERERDNIMQGMLSAGGKQQPVDSQCDTGTVRQTGFQCSKQVLVHANRCITRCLTATALHAETPPLFTGIGQLVKTVCQLHTIQVHLET
jgi:hypothetical protein